MPTTFGERLKQLRQEHGLTQEMLAERVGYTTQMIRKIEAGQRRPSFQVAAKLADELGVPPEERAHFIRSARDEPTEQPDAPPAELPDAPPEQAAARYTNLPPMLTRLIGREQEILRVRQRLLQPDLSLLTLVGPGGAGKTRLSVEAAAGLIDAFNDGILFVNLVPIQDPQLVIPTIADMLGVGEEGGRPRIERLKERLRDRQLLLVLDNFEQVTPAAPLLTELLAACPGLKALVTSRALLRVRGEYVLQVAPLPLPDSGQTDADTLMQSAAVRLFVERAAAVQPDFTLTEKNAPAIAELCRRLDGLPLAIELAAARSTLFTPEAMLARLRKRLQLLTEGPRDLPTRQQTLWNTLAWSYDLLTEPEQRLFRRLSIFNGRRTLDAISAVCGGTTELDLINGLASLIDKSLLSQDLQSDDEPGFLMLETIREYGLEQLERSGEAEDARRAHAGYYLRLVEQARPHLWGGAQEYWLHRLEQEHDNLRAALAWYITHDEGVTPALQMSGNLWRFWNIRGHWTEGRQWLEQALIRRNQAEPANRWVALHGAGNLALDLGDYTHARAHYEESLSITRSLELPQGIANSLLNLSLVILYQGETDYAIVLQEEALALHRSVNNRIGIGLALTNLARIWEQQGDYDRAAACAQESLTLYTDLQDQRGMAWALHTLGVLARRRGLYDHARNLLEECRSMYVKLEDRTDLLRLLNDLGELAEEQGDYAAAQTLYEQSLKLAAELGDRRSQAAVLNNLSRLAQYSGNEELALTLRNRSLALQRDLGDHWGMTITLEQPGKPAKQHEASRPKQ